MRSICLAVTIAISSSASSEVVRVDIRQQRPWMEGRDFGAGSYELLSGIVFYEVDPKDPSSRDIADIRNAPRNARGKVEFSGPFLILRPKDLARANGTTLFEVANRGSTQLDGVLADFDSLALVDNQTRDVSRPVLFDQGYTFAWAAWQGNLKPEEFGLAVPTAKVSSIARSAAFLGVKDGPTDASPVSQDWCAADVNDSKAVLRIHRTFDDPGALVPRGEWRFARKDEQGRPVSDPCAYVLAKPVTTPALVTVVYSVPQTQLLGLGQAAVRDFVSHLKYAELQSTLNERAGSGRQFVGYGYSQSGRFLRDFLYRGFNADARGRRVFDGVLDTASGAGRGSFNHRLASPGQAGNSVGSALRAVDIYPFADVPTPDINGKGSEGLLDRAVNAGVQPKIMHILSSSEYWARAGSLLHTTTNGLKALKEAEDTRTYAFAGTAHGPRRPTNFLAKETSADYPYNDNEDLFLAMPALLNAMRRWIAADAEPPPSRYPELGTTLVPPGQLKFPAIPGVRVPVSPPPVWQLDLGKKYRSEGIISEPPQVGARYPLLIPQVEADGNEIGSYAGLTRSVPLGTYTAWNHLSPDLDGFGYLSGLQGAFVPFPRTKAAREKTKDPRPSIDERYGGLAGYMVAVDKEIEKQVSGGFLLPEERAHARTWMRLVWDRMETLDRHWPRKGE